MTHLTNDKSFNAYRHLFQFVVADFHVGKVLILTFKATDGLKAIVKKLVVKFVSERLEIYHPPTWSEADFRGYKDGEEITFNEG